MGITEKTKKAQAAAEIIGVLADLFPSAFVLYQWNRKPLKLGIRDDLRAACAGAVTPNELQNALRRYCTSDGYLVALREGAARIDLGGNAVGIVSTDQAAQAGKVLAARRERQAAKRRAKPITPYQTNTAPRRVSLADLKAARARREAVR
jgi:ProP effector